VSVSVFFTNHVMMMRTVMRTESRNVRKLRAYLNGQSCVNYYTFAPEYFDFLYKPACTSY